MTLPAWYKYQNSHKCPKLIKEGVKGVFRASEARAPEHSVARCKALFCVVSLGAKQGLHRVSDSSRSNHDLITFNILLMKHFCALWLF